MNNSIKIPIGAVIVALAGIQSVASETPTPISPSSMSVLYPMAIVSELDLPDRIQFTWVVLPITVLYFFYSVKFVRRPYRVPTITKVLASTLIILSIIYNIAGYGSSVQHQGNIHTLLVYIFNILFLMILGYVYTTNKIAPSFNSCLGFNVGLFSWLAWVAYPDLGLIAI